MKKLLKNVLVTCIMMALLCTLCPVAPSAAVSRKCYTISSGNTSVYSNTGLTRKIGTIYGSDQITVNDVRSAYTHVTYPISGNRRKSGYIRTSAILLNTGGNSYKARARITTYRRPGGASYGYVENGDTVTVLGTSGGHTQVKYPASGGYKYAFVTTSDANRAFYVTPDYSSIANGTYVFYSAVGSNKTLDVNGGSSSNGTNIHLWEANGSAAQKFNVSKLSNGWYKIANVNGKSLDVNGSERRSGANVHQWEWHGGSNQQWRFVSAGNGYYYIQNALGYYLDVNGAGTSNGTNVQVWEKNDSNAQKWKLAGASNISNTGTTYYVTTQAGLCLRKSASTISATLTTMPYGASVSVYSISNGWANLSYNGKNGYASAAYLSQTRPSGSNWDNKVGRTVANIDSYYYTSGNVSYRGGYKGQCTWYAYGRFYEVNGIALKSARHAKYWLTDNRSDGRVYISSSIKPKSIAVRTSGSYGHVMFVEEVTYSGSSPQYVYFTECNTDGNGKYDAGRDCIVQKMSYSNFMSRKKPAGFIVKR